MIVVINSHNTRINFDFINSDLWNFCTVVIIYIIFIIFSWKAQTIASQIYKLLMLKRKDTEVN